MTVSSIINKVIYNGNDLTTEWPITFSVDGIEASDIKVYIVDLTGTSNLITENYQVNLDDLNVSYPTTTVPPLDPLPTGYQIILLRELALTQEIDLKIQGGISPVVVEDGLDRVTMIIQQFNEKLNRALLADLSGATYDASVLMAQLIALRDDAIAQADAAEASANSAAYSALLAAASANSAVVLALIAQVEGYISDVQDIADDALASANSAAASVSQAATAATTAITDIFTGLTSYHQGDILYDNGSKIVRLVPGTSGQFLKTQGSSANPVWADVTIFPDYTASGTGSDEAGSTDITTLTVTGAYTKITSMTALPRAGIIDVTMTIKNSGNWDYSWKIAKNNGATTLSTGSVTSTQSTYAVKTAANQTVAIGDTIEVWAKQDSVGSGDFSVKDFYIKVDNPTDTAFAIMHSKTPVSRV